MSNQSADGRAVDARRGYTRTIVDDNGPITAAQLEACMGLLIDRVSDMCAEQREAMRDAVRRGTHDGMREAVKDPAFSESFWLAGFEEFKKHTTNQASQWVGKRFLTWIIVGVLTFLAAWLVRNGGK